jgi:uncharacterized protein
VIDDHAHPFPLTYAPLDLGDVRLGPDGAGGLFQELLFRRLAGTLGLSPTAEDAEVVAARDEAAADWGGYVRRLFDDAGIAGMVLDFGVPSPTGGQAGDYAALLGRPIWWLARIDPLVDEMLSSGSGARAVVTAVEGLMAEAVDGGAVGFKTIAAYRTGLRVDPSVTLAEAEASLGHDRDLPVRRRAKALRDLVTRTVLERAADTGRPVQFHTGFGDSDIRLAESDPLLLEELLRSPAGQAATIVLIHGAHPWEEELAYLATVRPNVFAEISLSNLFAPLGTADRLLRLIDLAPLHKLLAGSDGHLLPETHWFGCRMLAEGFEEAARRLRAAGVRDGFLSATRDALFENNARSVYRLD